MDVTFSASAGGEETYYYRMLLYGQNNFDWPPGSQPSQPPMEPPQQ